MSIENMKFTPEDIRLNQEFIKKLNSQPPEAWTKYHRFGRFHYVPIEFQMELANEVFGYWTFEVQETILSQAITSKGDVATVCAVSGKLWYWHPLLNRMMFTGGAGSTSVAGKQDVGVLAPKAKTEALKNCFNTWKLFGGGLNRKAEDQALGTMTGMGDRLVASLSEIKEDEV